MKKLTLFTPLFMMIALSITLPERGLSAESPKIEKAALKRDFVKSDQTYIYLFDFDFVNALAQPLEIISVNVFDVNGRRVEQDWAIRGRNWDPRLMTHALSGNHPLAKIISKPRGTPLEQATVSPVGDRIEIKVTNRILLAGQGIRPSMYMLSSKNNYDSLILRVVYRVNGNLQEVSHTFTEISKKEISPPPGRACMFYAPNVTNVHGLIGHVGWAFRDSVGNKWVFGATENTKGQAWISPGKPADTQSWQDTGTWAQVLQTFGTGKHLNRGPNYYSVPLQVVDLLFLLYLILENTFINIFNDLKNINRILRIPRSVKDRYIKATVVSTSKLVIQILLRRKRMMGKKVAMTGVPTTVLPRA